MSLFEIIIIAALATYRLTAMLHDEAGPGDVFIKLRTRLGVKFDQYSNTYSTGFWSSVVLCFYCLSVWIAAAIWLWIVGMGIAGYPLIGVFALVPFALSGIAVFLKKWVG